MRYLFGLFCLLLAITVQAELLKVQPFHYSRKPSPTAGNESLRLPFVTANSMQVAKKINNTIFMDIFQSPAPAKLNSKLTLPKIDGTEFDEASGIYALDYRVLLNNGKVLALATQGEYCGAYCEESKHYYHFDAQNGRQLKIEALIKSTSLKSLQNKVLQARVSKMKKTIKALKKQLAADEKKGKKYDEEDDPESKVLLYESCIAEATNANKEFGYNGELENFYMNDKGITFAHERCSNHAMRALDDIDVFSNFYDYNTLKPYFSDDAKALLHSNKVAR